MIYSAVSQDLVARLARGLRDNDTTGWERTPAGWFLDIPGIGFARITGDRRLICIAEPGGQRIQFPVRSVRWSFSVEISTDNPGLAIVISPTEAGRPDEERE